MDFDLSDSHLELRRVVRNFCEKELRPHVGAWDRNHHFPAEIVPKLADIGLLGIKLPVEYGGAGLDILSYVLCVEEVARIDGSLGLLIASHNGLGTSHIAKFGSEAQKQKYLPKAASGEWLAAWALTEPGSGSDSASLTTTARREDDQWCINGSKTFITQGSVGAFCVLLARTGSDKHRGISAFIVDRGTPGFSASRTFEKLGMRASDTAELSFDDVRVGDAQLIGDEGNGFIDSMKILDIGRISIAALALGLAAGALEMAARYAQERSQFGKPIADFQAIQWMLADSMTELEAARLLTYRAAWLADHGRAHGPESSMAKLFASETASRVCNRSLQIHGGYGYTTEFAIERHFRDAKLTEIGEGTSEIQRLIIARHVLSLWG
jgi:alkylation response protein AidB-like acyl-CoA dehydrogenase